MVLTIGLILYALCGIYTMAHFMKDNKDFIEAFEIIHIALVILFVILLWPLFYVIFKFVIND